MFSKKTTKQRRMLLKDAVPTIPVREGKAVCEDDLIRLHELLGIKKRKRKAASDVETLLAEYFEGVAGEDDHLPQLKEQVSEKVHKFNEVEEEDSFHDIDDDSFTSARICDSNKARQIASEILSSESDVQMLVVVTPEDLQAYNQNINLGNKRSLKALMNDSPKYKMDDIRNVTAGMSATTIRNNANVTLPDKLVDQHKENSCPPCGKIVEENPTILCWSQKTLSFVQQKNNSIFGAINPLVNTQCSAVKNKNDNTSKVASHLKEPKEFYSNRKHMDHLYHSELNTGARNKNIPFTEVTNTADVITLSDDSSPQSSPEKSPRQHNHLPVSSIDHEMRQLSTSDEEDIDSPENVAELSTSKQVDIIKCFTLQSGKSLLVQADDDDLKILNCRDASDAYSNYDFFNSSVTSDNSEPEQLEEEEEGEGEESYEELEEEEEEEDDDDEVPEVEEDENNSYELPSSRILASTKKSDKSSDIDLIEENVENTKNKSAENRINALEIENEKLKIENEKVKSENDKLKRENDKLKREKFALAAFLKSHEHVKQVLKQNLSGFLRELVLHEYERRLMNHSQFRYPYEVRTFANTVYLNSPTTYRYLRTLLKLPNPSDLEVTLSALRKQLKTDDRKELIKHIHGTDLGEDNFLGGVEENEPLVEMSRDRQVILIESDNEFHEETNENEPTEELTSAEMIRRDLTEESLDESIGLIENDTNEVSSQLLNLIENCEVYFEDEAGNIIPPDSEQIMAYVESATKMVEEIGPDGQKRYVILQTDDEERKTQGHVTTVEVSESPEQNQNTTQSRKKLVAQKKSKVIQNPTRRIAILKSGILLSKVK